MEELFEDIEIDVWLPPITPSLPLPPDCRSRRRGCGPDEMSRSHLNATHEVTMMGYSPCSNGGAVLQQASQKQAQRHAVVASAGVAVPSSTGAPSAATAPCNCSIAGQRGGVMASRGSQGHWVGDCVPCKYLRSKRGCIKGEDCELCHLLHAEVGYTGARRMMRASAERRRGCAASSASSSSSAGNSSGSSPP